MVTFHTNLDLAKQFVQNLHASHLEEVPRKSDRIRFGAERTFELEVVARTFDSITGNVAIELHLPSYDTRSIKDWETWFTNHMLRRDEPARMP